MYVCIYICIYIGLWAICICNRKQAHVLKSRCSLILIFK